MLWADICTFLSTATAFTVAKKQQKIQVTQQKDGKKTVENVHTQLGNLMTWEVGVFGWHYSKWNKPNKDIQIFI